jgi:hypothetical protein
MRRSAIAADLCDALTDSSGGGDLTGLGFGDDGSGGDGEEK